MPEPKEIEKLFLFAAVCGPIIGLLIAAVSSARARVPYLRCVAGFLIGLLGTFVYLLWKLYNYIAGAFGLDSVLNLSIQLILFIIAGAFAGFAAVNIKKLLNRA
jgi:hypothetical protein